MKLLILGIDALDRLLLDQFEDRLPNFTALKRNVVSLKVTSTFPPDSDTAWATIMTGLNPAQHGIVKFIDPLEKSYQLLNKEKDNEILQGKTFWDIVARAGYKTAAIFPHLCFPLWDTPGLMVARSPTKPIVQSNRPEILQLYPDPEVLGGVRGFPDRSVKGMLDYFHQLKRMAEADAAFALRVLQRQDWDLFFVYWSTIDAVSHFFWNYFDASDPNFVDGHPLQGVIPETYQLFDRILGLFLSEVGEDVPLIILSDHGHGARPSTLFNVNEVLRQKGYLATRDLRANPHVNLFEKLKRLAVKTVSNFGLGRMASRVMRNFPGVVQSFTRPALVDWQKTFAYATDMSGIKAYAYGGININRAALNGRGYEQVRSEIIDLISEIAILGDGTPLVERIARREDLYNGSHIDKYPDILLELKYGYGLGWSTHVPLFTQAASNNLVPGSHRGETGTFIMRGHYSPVKDTMDLLDITPTILELLGVSASVGQVN